MSPNLDRHIVTAVLVAHDGGQWLPETLKALLSQTQPIQRLVAVDTGSRDRGPAVLAEIVGAGNLLTMSRTSGYGAAVEEALRHPAASIAVPEPEDAYDLPGSLPPPRPGIRPGERVEWVWLIHDDSAPTTETLRMLLTAAEANPGAVVLGPKLRDWHDRRVLAEAGVTIDGAGRRDTGLDRGEFDQGQHDGLRDVFAVSTAGMLVRRDVWAELGGLDPELGLFRDDVDLGWRAWAAGHRVVLVTDAVMYHAEASVRGLRSGVTRGEHGHRPRRLDRRNALFLLLAHLPFPGVLGTFTRVVFGSLLRTLAFLLVKRPSAAADELAALRDILTSPGRMWRGRRARKAGRRRGHIAFKRFQLSSQTARRLSDLSGTFLSRRDPFTDDGGRPYPEPGEDDELPEEPGAMRALLTRPSVVMLLFLVAVSVVAERSVLFAGSGLGGGALIPASGGASDLWRDYLSGWHPVGLGSDAGSPPYIGVLALLSTLLLGKPWLAVAVLLLGGIPLAGLSAYLAARRLVPSRVVGAWMATTYALLPVATGAVSAGRLGTVVVLILLPLIAVSVSRMLLGPPAGIRQAAWASGLLLAVAMAFVPLIWLLVLVAGALVWFAFGARVRGLGAAMVIALAVPPLLQLPTTLRLLAHPSGFLVEAGLNRPGMTAAELPAESLLALNPGGPGTPAPWVTAGVLLVGLTALAVRRRRLVILAGWLLALYGILTAILVEAIPVPQGNGTGPAWPGIALALAAIGVLLAAAGAAQWGSDLFARGGLPRRAGAVAIGLAALATPALAAASWVTTGARGPLTGTDPEVVPAFIGASGRDALQPRTLVLREDGAGRVAYTVLRGRAPRIGEAETPVDAAARRRLDAQVAGLASARSGDEGGALARFGIQYILVPGPAGRLTRTLDGLPELSRLSRTNAYSTWRVAQPTGRVMLVDRGRVTPLPSGPVEARFTLPAAPGPRLLLLAEPADGGWHATLNGRDVKSRSVDGWAQGYDIPPAGGRFVLTRGMWLRHVWLILQAAALLVVGVLALPGRAQRLEEPWAWGPGRSAGRAVGKALRRRRRAGDDGAAGDGTADQSGDATAGRTGDPEPQVPAHPTPVAGSTGRLGGGLGGAVGGALGTGLGAGTGIESGPAVAGSDPATGPGAPDPGAADGWGGAAAPGGAAGLGYSAGLGASGLDGGAGHDSGAELGGEPGFDSAAGSGRWGRVAGLGGGDAGSSPAAGSRSTAWFGTAAGEPGSGGSGTDPGTAAPGPRPTEQGAFDPRTDRDEAEQVSERPRRGRHGRAGRGGRGRGGRRRKDTGLRARWRRSRADNQASGTDPDVAGDGDDVTNDTASGGTGNTNDTENGEVPTTGWQG